MFSKKYPPSTMWPLILYYMAKFTLFLKYIRLESVESKQLGPNAFTHGKQAVSSRKIGGK